MDDYPKRGVPRNDEAREQVWLAVFLMATSMGAIGASMATIQADLAVEAFDQRFRKQAPEATQDE